MMNCCGEVSIHRLPGEMYVAVEYILNTMSRSGFSEQPVPMLNFLVG